ncbi:MAG TPA: RNA 2',3'-cyclic phosphodiesterase [Candidatus Dormibacteraeota bacterium]|nr:RNA 2',3'-cyclic phosphodiesterase [Candidatus Dormibacteraeota bacterium]
MRLFVALDLPDEVRRSLADVIEQLQPKFRAARWVRPEAMHLTLKFIGHAIADADAQKLSDLRTALATVRSDRAVELRYRGIGFFPNSRRPRVIWCGVEASANLAQIAADIETAIEPLSIPREERTFVPHLTLARIESPKGTEPLVRAAEQLQSAEFGSSTETQFYLFESKTKPSGAEYKKIDAFPFAKGSE